MTAMFVGLPSAGAERLLIDVLWQGALIGVVVWVVLWGLRPRACLRSAILWWSLVAMLLAPATTWLVRSRGGGLLATEALAPAASDSPQNPPGTVAPPLPAAETAARRSAPSTAAVSVAGERTAASAAEAWLPRIVGDDPTESTAWSADSLAGWLASVWALWSIVCLIRLTRNARRTARLWRGAAPLTEDALLAMVARTAESLGLERVPAVRQSAAITTPAVIGWGAPRLLWPASGVPDTQCQAVLWHELAHLARGDGWGVLVAELVVSAIPFQPLAALVKRRYRLACEEACDDWVLAGGVAPLDLAEILAGWLPGPAAPLSLAMAESPAAARARILRLLSLSEAPQPTIARRVRWGLVALALGLTTSLALLQVRRVESQPATSDLLPGPPESEPLAPREPATSAPQAGNLAPPAGAAAATEPLLLGPGDVIGWRFLTLNVAPHRPLETGDALRIRVTNTLPDYPVDEVFTIDGYGRVSFAPPYGRLELAGKTIDEASELVIQFFEQIIRSPEVSVTLELRPDDVFSRTIFVLDDQGNLSVPRYGRFELAGLTLPQAREVAVAQLAAKGYQADLQLELVESPRNVIYLVVNYVAPGTPTAAPADRGTEVQRLVLGQPHSPQTVLDVIASKQLRLGPRANLRLLRTGSSGQVSELPVNWLDVVSGRSMASNYPLQPGDRLYVDGAWELDPPPDATPAARR